MSPAPRSTQPYSPQWQKFRRENWGGGLALTSDFLPFVSRRIISGIDTGQTKILNDPFADGYELIPFGTGTAGNTAAIGIYELIDPNAVTGEEPLGALPIGESVLLVRLASLICTLGTFPSVGTAVPPPNTFYREIALTKTSHLSAIEAAMGTGRGVAAKYGSASATDVARFWLPNITGNALVVTMGNTATTGINMLIRGFRMR